ncbi:MAG: PepSY domain-containing protein [Burkholderiales bacterium]|nr:PepSY domain-containing protein [Burkholderiales bacterium]
MPIFFVLLLILPANPVFPQDFSLVAEASHVSLSQAIEIAKNRTGGQVLSAQSEGGAYRIKVLTPSGEVIVLQVDAATGAVR